jgi:hydroxymethylpyrimidine pyrophosphatase-like HAD family hydrolase
MRSVVFTDLDETLLHSLRRRAATSGDRLAAVDQQGAPSSYQTAHQEEIFRWLSQADRVIPVTGRSVGSYARVRLPFYHEAVVHHGALVLLSDGTPEPDYVATVQSDLEEVHPTLEDAWIHVQSWIHRSGAPLRTYRQSLHGLTVEVCVKHVSRDATELGAWGDELAERWAGLGSEVRVHHNGNNLALLPRHVDKLRAVRWLQERLVNELGPLLTLGAGDSRTDHPFLSACDFFIVPRGSQLANSLAGGS